MGYQGQVATIPLGKAGLHTDDPQDDIPPGDLLESTNVTFENNVAEKAPGSIRYNSSALTSGVVAVYDWWPMPWKQRMVAVTRDGKVWLFRNRTSATEITPNGDAPTALTINGQVKILQVGNESSGRSKKLMILSGNDPIQIISGDNLTRSNITSPAADWAIGNYPSFAFMSRNRVIAIGCDDNPHRVYVSDDDDHEQFASGGGTIAIYPGEGDKLFGGYVYKGRAFLFKYPIGVYFIDDSGGSTPDTWIPKRASASFGVASPHAIIEPMDDLLLANAEGSVTSLQATQAFGDVRSGDVLNNLRCEKYILKNSNPVGNPDRHAIYYKHKKQIFFSYRSAAGTRNDRLLMMDVSNPQKARVSWLTKDQPNCLALRKDIRGIDRPIYGAEDGFIYLMDRTGRAVNGSAYSMDLQTSHMDFAGGDPAQAESNKLFDFLEVVFEPTGRWSVSIDVLIDGKFSETINFQASWGNVLGDFPLGTSRLTPPVPRSARKELHGMGRRISFRCYNSGSYQNIRLVKLRVYYRYSGQQQKDGEE